jgi:excisionase family DNA binding protein
MDTLLTVNEVAEILGISPTTAKIWASQRRFPVVKIGRLVRVTPDALEAWIRDPKVRGSNPLRHAPFVLEAGKSPIVPLNRCRIPPRFGRNLHGRSYSRRAT